MSITVGPPAFSDSVFATGEIFHEGIFIVRGTEFGKTGVKPMHYVEDDDFFSLIVRGETRDGIRHYYYAFDEGAWHDRTDAELKNRPPNFYERRGGRPDAQVVSDYGPIIDAFKAGKPPPPGNKTQNDALQRRVTSQSACISSIKQIADTCGR